MRIGIVGLGELGSLIARGLLGAGHEVVAYDPDPGAAAELPSAGLVRAASVAELAKHSAVALVAVATDAQARTVAAELFAEAPPSTGGVTTMVLHSTVGPRTPVELASNAPAGLLVLDAPVSIHRDGEARRCVAYLGAEIPLPEAVRQTMEIYCREVVVVGGLGTGQLLKLVNNTMSLLNTAAAAEALRLAAAHGLDPDLVRDLVLRGSGASHALATWSARAGLFDTAADDRRRRALAVKDLYAAVDLAVAAGLDLPLARRAVELISGAAGTARSRSAVTL